VRILESQLNEKTFFEKKSFENNPKLSTNSNLFNFVPREKDLSFLNGEYGRSRDLLFNY
jgi:hypothetical protein